MALVEVDAADLSRLDRRSSDGDEVADEVEVVGLCVPSDGRRLARVDAPPRDVRLDLACRVATAWLAEPGPLAVGT